MTNNTPWQVTLNANNPGHVILSGNNLTVVKKGTGLKKTSVATAKTVVMPKRYSFDDNGGGYRGL